MSSFSDEHAAHYSSDAPGLVVTKTEHPVAQRPKNRSRFRNPRPRSFGDDSGTLIWLTYDLALSRAVDATCLATPFLWNRHDVRKALIHPLTNANVRRGTTWVRTLQSQRSDWCAQNSALLGFLPARETWHSSTEQPAQATR